MDISRMRTWAEISLNSLERNYAALTSRTSGSRVIGVVKADAYGHGALPVSKRLVERGCGLLAVACFSEALELREGGIDAPILILGYTPPELTRELTHLQITQTIADARTAREYSRIAGERGERLRVHIKVDTGMSRLGFSWESPGELFEVMGLKNLDVEGIFTHFAVPESDGDFTREQFRRFTSVTDTLERGGVRIPLKHCANSGAVVQYDYMRLDMTRPGILLYGYAPAPERCDMELHPVMALKTRIAQIRDLAPGDTVSYGRRYRASRETKIAVLPVGYADGLFRSLTNKLEVTLDGVRAPQVGTICMDMCMVDVTDIPNAAPGDIVTVFGGDQGISVWEAARHAETIPYELLCAVSKRVPRVYVD